jgi:Uma2 family endonuclease
MVDAGILDEREPLELLDGELVVVTPQGPEHAAAATELHRLLVEAYAGVAVTVREDKPIAVGTDALPEPDVAVVRGGWTTFASRHPRGDEALVVIELARTTLALDRAKASIYARGGVPAYWLVDFDARRIELHTDPHADGHYGIVRILSEDDAAELPGTNHAVRARDFIPR